MMRRKFMPIAGVMFFLSGAAGACSDSSTSPVASAGAWKAALERRLPRADARSLDDEMLRVAQLEPAFAGMYRGRTVASSLGQRMSLGESPQSQRCGPSSPTRTD